MSTDRQFHGFPKADTTGSSSCSGSPHTARPQARQPPLGPSSMELPNRHSNWVADWLSPFLQLDLPSIRSTDTKSPTKKNAAAVLSCSSHDKVQRILLSGPNWRNSGSETGQRVREPPHLYVDIETLAADEEEDAECEPWQDLLHGEEKEEALDSSGKAIWGAGRLLLRALSPSGVLSGYHRALAQYRPRHSRSTRTTNIVELGCGTGIGGLSLAALLRDTMNQGHQARSDENVRVVLTDGCPVAVRLAGRNAERWASAAFPGTTAANARVSVEARQLRWGGTAAKSTGSEAAKGELLHDIIGTDLLLCTDLAYDAAHYVSLMATILTLSTAVEVGGVPSPEEPEPEPDRNFRKNEFQVKSTAGDFSSALFWERDILGRLGLLLEGPEGKDDNVAASGGRRRLCGSSSSNRADKNIFPAPGPPRYMLFAMRKRSREEAALLHILGMYFRFRLVDVCRTDRQKKGLPTLLYVCELRRKHEGFKESRELKMEVVEDSSLFSDSSGGVHLHQEGIRRTRNKCQSLHFCARKVVQSAVLEEIANAECELASSSAESDADTATTSSDEGESDGNIANISHVDERRSSRPARGARVYKDWLTRGRYDPQWQTITGCH